MAQHPFNTFTSPSFEIEFLPVGDASRSGDAIVLSWLEGPGGPRRIVVVDGGYASTGETIVELIGSRFSTRDVDLVINTHPDADHSNGLAVVLEKCRVGELLMHKPWEHPGGLYSGRFADRSVPTAVVASLDSVKLLAEEALQRGVRVTEPFAGEARLGVIEILGPTEPYYESLLADFRTPVTKSHVASAAGGTVLTRVRESLTTETLDDSGTTSAENNTSVITQVHLNNQRFLLTGDAGIPALHLAANRLDLTGADPGSLALVQVPHHGSKRNVGPAVLDRLLGPVTGTDSVRRPAVVSAAPDGEPKHPARQVTNAFRRRGTPVYPTQGRAIRFAHNAPLVGYEPLEPLPFFPDVEA